VVLAFSPQLILHESSPATDATVDVVKEIAK
jgi:hypothetical protein